MANRSLLEWDSGFVSFATDFGAVGMAMAVGEAVRIFYTCKFHDGRGSWRLDFVAPAVARLEVGNMMVLESDGTRTNGRNLRIIGHQIWQGCRCACCVLVADGSMY